MRTSRVLSILACAATCGVLTGTVWAVELMPVIDYRDTFTVGGYRPAGYYIGPPLIQVPYDMKYNIEYANPALPSEDLWKDPGTISFQSPSTAVAQYPGNTGNPGMHPGWRSRAAAWHRLPTANATTTSSRPT